MNRREAGGCGCDQQRSRRRVGGRKWGGAARRAGAHHGQLQPTSRQLRARAGGTPRCPPSPRAPAGHPSAERWLRSVRSQRCVPMSRCELGILGRRSARRAIPDGKRLHPRSQPGLLSRRCRLWRPPGCMHWDDALASLHRTGDPRVPCAAIEGHGLIDRYGHGNGTASGPLGGAHPVTRSPLGHRLELAACRRRRSAPIREPLG